MLKESGLVAIIIRRFEANLIQYFSTFTYYYLLLYLYLFIYFSIIMPRHNLSFFEEKRNTVEAATEWGCWWQTVQEIHIQGELFRTIYSDEVVWTIEDRKLCIVLTKSDYSVKDDMWKSLLINGKYQPDPLILHEMRKNLDLERFQIENPGMDFSKAQLCKQYDK